MEHIDKAKELESISARSAGAAQAKYQNYLDSIEASTKRIQAAWENIVNKIKESKFLKTVFDGIANVVEKIPDLIATFGGLVATPLLYKTIGRLADKSLNGFGSSKEGRKGLLGKITGLGKSGEEMLDDAANPLRWRQKMHKDMTSVIEILRNISDNTDPNKKVEDNKKMDSGVDNSSKSQTQSTPTPAQQVGSKKNKQDIGAEYKKAQEEESKALNKLRESQTPLRQNTTAYAEALDNHSRDTQVLVLQKAKIEEAKARKAQLQATLDKSEDVDLRIKEAQKEQKSLNKNLGDLTTLEARVQGIDERITNAQNTAFYDEIYYKNKLGMKLDEHEKAVLRDAEPANLARLENTRQRLLDEKKLYDESVDKIKVLKQEQLEATKLPEQIKQVDNEISKLKSQYTELEKQAQTSKDELNTRQIEYEKSKTTHTTNLAEYRKAEALTNKLKKRGEAAIKREAEAERIRQKTVDVDNLSLAIDGSDSRISTSGLINMGSYVDKNGNRQVMFTDAQGKNYGVNQDGSLSIIDSRLYGQVHKGGRINRIGFVRNTQQTEITKNLNTGKTTNGAAVYRDNENSEWRYTRSKQVVNKQDSVTADTAQEIVTTNIDTQYVKKNGRWYDLNGNAVNKETVQEIKKGSKKTVQQKQHDKAATRRNIQRVGTGVVTGTITGFTTAMNLTDKDGHSASNKAKAYTGAIGGVVTAALTAWLGPLGSMLGGLFTQVIGKQFARLFDKQDYARRVRSEEATKAYSTLKSIQNSTNTLKEIATTGDLSYSGYQKAKSATEDISLKLRSDSTAAREFYKEYLIAAKGLTDAEAEEATQEGKLNNYALSAMIDNILNEYLTGNNETRKIITDSFAKAEANALAQTFENSQEENLYQYEKAIKDNTTGQSVTKLTWNKASRKIVDAFIDENSNLFEGTRNGTQITYKGDAQQRLSTQQKLLAALENEGLVDGAAYTSLQKSVSTLNNALNNLDTTVTDINKNRVEAAAVDAGILDFTSAQIKELGKDEIARLLLEEINKEGIYLNESLTDYREGWLGSYDDLSNTVKQYIDNYINSNEQLYNAFQGTSYTLNEVLVKGKLGEVIYQENGLIDYEKTNKDTLNYLNTYAQTMGIGLNDLSSLVERYGDTELGTIMRGVNELNTEVKDINSIIGNLQKGMTYDLLEEIITKFPGLINYAGNQTELMTQLFNRQANIIDAMTAQLKRELLDNTEIYDNIKTKISDYQFSKNPVENEFYDWFYNQNKFGDVKNTEEFIHQYESAYQSINSMDLTDEEKETLREKYSSYYSEIKKDLDNMFGETISISIDTTALDTVSRYLSKMYQKQIDNLNAQKQALSEINNQREYEIKLIEARQKLENLQNEKKQVYRAGVGFVYEADQQAISEQQKIVDELENQKETDALEMQIQELQSQKEYLEQLPDREEFKNLQKSFDALKNSSIDLGDASGTLTTALYAVVKAYSKTSMVDLSDSTKDAETMNEENQELALANLKKAIDSNDNYYEAYKQIQKAYETGNYSGLNQQHFVDILGNTEQADQAYTAIEEFNKNPQDESSIIKAAKVVNDAMTTATTHLNTSLGSVATAANNAVSAGVQESEINKLIKDSSMSQAAAKANESDSQVKTLNTTAEINDFNRDLASKLDSSNSVKMPQSQIDSVKLQLYNSVVEKLRNANSINEPDMGRVYYSYVNADGTAINTSANFTYNGKNTSVGEAAKAYLKSLGLDQVTISSTEDLSSEKLVLNAGGWGKNFKPYIQEAWEEIPYQTNDITKKYLKYGSTLAKAHENDAVGDGSSRDVVDLDLLKQGLNELVNDESLIPRYESNGYALGSLFTGSEIASISEKGPEIFTTPNLSGTALIPEGSKVIPTEAAAGLWKLGALANQFIQPLKSLMNTYSTNNTFGGTDESMNINTLNITMRADKDFDMDQFIQQLRSVQALTKHNH